YARAMRQYQNASNDKDPRIQSSAFNRIGELFASGLGVGQNDAESFKWFRNAALLGNPFAEANLGNSYFFGIGVGRNIEEAKRWLERGAEQGVPLAMDQLAWL